ncbi:MAG: FeoA domain-containing protein [Chloroflexi bacterium]|nr:FeoA domain-containing protein [Chloroflexota bacterium]
MKLEDKAEEILESLWIAVEEDRQDHLSVAELETACGDWPLEQLVHAGLVTIEGDQVRLTEQGRPSARQVVRRHRLGERLLADVLNTGGTLLHDKACKFEHLLDRGLDESICSLLGHPKVCPHGRPIPPGRCCQEGSSGPRKLVVPLSEMSPGQEGKIAYLYTKGTSDMQKLTSMGVFPGTPVKLLQAFPSYVFQVHQSQFAVDKAMADSIYVRLAEPAEARRPPQRRRRFGWMRRLWAAGQTS